MRNLRQIFSKNGYPASFFNRILDKFQTQSDGALPNQDLDSSREQERKFFLPVPYLHKPSKTFFKNVQLLIKSKLDIEITAIFETTKICSYFNIKNRTPSYLQSNVVYKCTCSRYVNATYLCYSAHLITRAKEHTTVTRISDCKSNKSAIKNHILNCISCLAKNHKFQLDRFSVMRKCNGAHEAKIHGAFLIKKRRIQLSMSKCMQVEPPFYWVCNVLIIFF